MEDLLPVGCKVRVKQTAGIHPPCTRNLKGIIIAIDTDNGGMLNPNSGKQEVLYKVKLFDPLPYTLLGDPCWFYWKNELCVIDEKQDHKSHVRLLRI